MSDDESFRYENAFFEERIAASRLLAFRRVQRKIPVPEPKPQHIRKNVDALSKALVNKSELRTLPKGEKLYPIDGEGSARFSSSD